MLYILRNINILKLPPGQSYTYATVRYIKYSVKGNTHNNYGHIVEFIVYERTPEGNSEKSSLISLILSTSMFTKSGSYAINSYICDGLNPSEYYDMGAGLQWVQCDLGAVKNIGRVTIVPYYLGRSYIDPEIEISTDGANWISVLEYSRSGKSKCIWICS
jgi:hypothetical protein